jgi:hypothetical protein
MTDIFASMKQQKEEVKEKVETKLSEVKRVEVNDKTLNLKIAEKQVGAMEKQEGKSEKQEKIKQFELSRDQVDQVELSAHKDDIYTKKIGDFFKGPDRNLLEFNVRTTELNKKLLEAKDEQEYKETLEQLIKIRKEEKNYIQELLKKEDLNIEQKELLQKRLEKINEDITFYTKELLGTRNTRDERVRDNILENTILQNKKIKELAEENAYKSISDYYLTGLELKKEILKINSENITEEEKEKKKENIFNEHYNTLKVNDNDHDETVKSFLYYNLSIKSERKNNAKEMDITTTNNEKINFEKRKEQEIEKQNNFLKYTIPIKR